MDNQAKLNAILQIIFNKTMPKDQLGFYTEADLARDIANILNS